MHIYMLYNAYQHTHTLFIGETQTKASQFYLAANQS